MYKDLTFLWEGNRFKFPLSELSCKTYLTIVSLNGFNLFMTRNLFCSLGKYGFTKVIVKYAFELLNLVLFSFLHSKFMIRIPV